MKDFAILFTDVFSRKTFDLFNIIMKRFSEIEPLISFENHALDSLRLRLVYPKSTFEKLSTADYSGFEKSLNKIVERHNKQKVIFLPIEESTTLLFYEYIKKNSAEHFLFSLPEESVFRQVRDKTSLMRFCIENSFPHPRTYESLNELDKLAVDHKLLSKPALGEGSKGIVRFTREDASEQLFKNRTVQDEIEQSEGVIGVFLNCKNGKVNGQYCHQRNRTFPLKGGVTVLSEIVKSDRCLELAKEIVSKLSWDGLIMLEFLYDQNSKEYLLLEINPRLWGSLLLSEVNLQGLITLHISELINVECKMVTPPTGYRIRWVWPYDFMYVLTGKISWKEFFHKKNTVFVNWTYASKTQALSFMLFSLIDLNKWKNLLKKI